MKVTLQVSDIAMYLPYGLTFLNTHGEVKELDCISGSSVNIKGRSTTYGMYCDLDEIKPLLRPLSDLDKYGEDIPNCHKLNLLLGGGDNYGKEYIQHCNGAIDLEIEIDSNYCSYYMLSYKVMQKINYFLVENLYDINDLIGQGLAIDINTLKS